MRDALRLIALFRLYAGWMLADVAIDVAVVLVSVALLAVSGWSITGPGLAGLGLMTLNYPTPAATRDLTLGGDRSRTHDAKGQNVTVVTSGSGSVSVTSGDQGTLSVNAGKGGLSLAGQSIALTGSATLNGQPIKMG